MILSRQYLLFASGIALFRVSMYIFKPETVTKVKISSIAWKDPAIQEIAYAYTNLIRTWMLFKGVIFAYSSLFIQSSSNQDALALISFLFDAYTLSNMIYRRFLSSSSTSHDKNKVLLPPTTPAMTVQSLLTSSYLICQFLEYFQFV